MLFCVKIRIMKIKKFSVAKILLLGVSTAYGIYTMRKIHQKSKKFHPIYLEEVRQYMSQMGDIDVIYVDEKASALHTLTGGVVMSDGKIYHFCYRDGQIEYKEEKS